MTYPIPDAALDDRLAFIGTSGSGKTYNAGGAVERALDAGSRVVVVDPLDVWFGLALAANGRIPSDYRAGNRLVIFGGKHADLPLNEHSGALIGETVATMQESAIVSLGGLDTGAGERRFMLAFLDAIYRKATGEPFHLVVDEADLFAPQKPAKGEEKLLNRMEQIVRRGRVKGFVPWLISQRPAVLNKNVLSQADGLIAFKLTSSQDRDALGAWIEGQADRQRGKEILATLPKLQVGSGVVWIPGRDVFDITGFPKKQTFDSSRTPKRGEKKSTATLRPVDLGALKDRLASIEIETKANDPAELRRRISELEKAAKAAPAIDPKAIEEAEARGEANSALIWFRRGVEAALKAISGQLDGLNVPAFVQKEIAEWKSIGALPSSQLSMFPASPARQRESAPTAATVAAKPLPVSGNSNLPEGERKILAALIQFQGCERDQLSVLVGYKRSSRDAYIGRLIAKGYAEKDGATILPTAVGKAVAGDIDPLPRGRALQDYWQANLPAGEWRILEIAIAAYPLRMMRSDFDAAGFKRSSRDAYIGRLKARRLLDDSDGLRASETLF